MLRYQVCDLDWNPNPFIVNSLNVSRSLGSSYFLLPHYCLSLWFHWARLWYLPCMPLFCSILHAASYPTGSISEVGRHAYLMLFTCSDWVFFIVSPCFLFFFCFNCGWVGYVVLSCHYLPCVYCYSYYLHYCWYLYFVMLYFYSPNWLDALLRSAVWLPVWLYLLCAESLRC